MRTEPERDFSGTIRRKSVKRVGPSQKEENNSGLIFVENEEFFGIMQPKTDKFDSMRFPENPPGWYS